MSTCAACGRENPDRAVFCGGCGARLPAPVEAEAPAVRPVARPALDRRPSRTPLRIAGLVGFLALAVATGYKAASKPGRHVPPLDPRLRALPPPGPDDEPPPPPPAAAARAKQEPATEPAAEPRPAAAEPKPAAEPTPARPKSAARPKPKLKPKPSLGPPPGQDEIEACINTRKARLHACADEAAQQGEFVRRGYARATLSPSGKLSDISVPGGSVFSDCVTRVISSLRCRAFKGSPVEVTYRLR